MNPLSRLLATSLGTMLLLTTPAMAADQGPVPPSDSSQAATAKVVANGIVAGIAQTHPVAIAPDGQSLLTTTVSGKHLRLVSIPAGCDLWRARQPTGTILSVTISPNGRLAMAADTEGVIHLWDMATGRPIRRMTGHQGAVPQVSFSADGHLGLSVGVDGIFRIWDLKHETLHLAVSLETPLLTAAFTADDSRVLAGAADGSLFFVDANRHRKVWSLQAHRGPVLAVAILPNGGNLLSLGGDGELKSWTLAGEPAWTQPLPKGWNPNSRLLLAPTQGGLLTFDGNRTLQLWDLMTVAPKAAVTIPWTLPPSVGFDPRKNTAALYDGDEGFATVDMARQQTLHHFTTAHNSGGAPATHLTTRLPEGEIAAGTLWREPVTGMPFVWVPKGCFAMGCRDTSRKCSSEELPSHQVCLDGFWIGVNEVRQDEWETVMGFNPAAGQEVPAEAVNHVSWLDSHRLVCGMNRLSPVQFRLPTEAEWEMACRGESVVLPPDRVREPTIRRERDKEALQPEEKGNDAPPPGAPPGDEKAPPHPLGLQGMHNGVWEWVADMYDPDGYARHAFHDPDITGNESYRFSWNTFDRVTRGGSTNSQGRDSECVTRDFDDDNVRGFIHGLRLVAEPRVDTKP
ncbi:MAG: SUMF1/EgtB/PvdO family nonheme iron enzyme [Magnetococcales bacterium]|nr:SUMF1/EgtB/PvdO family nonheme iron enzyme [Magnetococcales bacterium]MBF0157606.1 SUMF1/EgtB/PvdO family nonheme iron enzyme [Magnetococcales bacterium]